MATVKLEYSRGDVISKKYEVTDVLDESPLGFTYRVRHMNTGKFVRLCMLRSNDTEALEACFQKAKALDHPNICKAGEIGEYQGAVFYTMEDFEGSTLRELMQEYKIAGKQFALKSASQVVTQVLEGLQHLHDNDLVLRALRPEYVLISVKYTGPRRQNFVAKVKIIGAGFWEHIPSGVLTEDEFTRGDAQYLAPELKSFEPIATPRCDLYSAGVVYYEMLTGTAPVGTYQLPSTLRPELPKHVNDVVELALANAPDDRYRTATDLAADIRRTFDSVVDDFDANPARVGPLAIVLGVVLIAALGAIIYSLLPGDQVTALRVLDQELRKPVVEHNKAFTNQELEKSAEGNPNMRYIPPGPFISGRLNFDPEASSDEDLAKIKELDYGFLIDQFEYPNRQGAEPLVGITSAAAAETCAKEGKRLCTAVEWEKACKGPLNQVYGYGDTHDDFCGVATARVPSGSMKDCFNPWGVRDIAGGVKEWTADSRDGQQVVKGGHPTKAAKGMRCAYTTSENLGYQNSIIGFRCCKDLDVGAPSDNAPAEPTEGEPTEGEPTEPAPE